jgi:cysteine-rich repeat protein
MVSSRALLALELVLSWLHLVEAQRNLFLDEDEEDIVIVTPPVEALTFAFPATPKELETLEAEGCDPGNEKLAGTRGHKYKGCARKTGGKFARFEEGLTCQKWTEQTPWEHKWTPDLYENLGDHNFCRNPYDQESIWCMTTDLFTRWDYCEPMSCGNGKVEVEAGEECDDGWWREGRSNANGDGCNKQCKVEPGFTCLVEKGKEAGRSYCTSCRNGKVEGAEACDDGNALRFDGCDPFCYVEKNWHCRPWKCGEGKKDHPCPEDVHSGLSFCKPDVCGDGIVWNNEKCDDGNLESSDGCSSDCRIEVGFTCESEDPDDPYGKSRCYNCGNGHIDFSEECDDGNEDPDDGCSPVCLLEKNAFYGESESDVPDTAEWLCQHTISQLEGVEEVSGNDTASVRTETKGTLCTPIKHALEKHGETIVYTAIGGGILIFLLVVLGYEVRKYRKNKLRVKTGEMLVVTSDGRIKKVNTMNAILTVQMALKRQIKRRRAKKAAEEEAEKKQEQLRKQAQRLQEKKWRQQMNNPAEGKYADGGGPSEAFADTV